MPDALPQALQMLLGHVIKRLVLVVLGNAFSQVVEQGVAASAIPEHVLGSLPDLPIVGRAIVRA